MKAQYTELYRNLRINYRRYCMIDEPGYSWHERLRAIERQIACPIRRAAITSWLARID